MKHFAVIGCPIEHSLSPLLHQEIYRQLDISASYEKKHVMTNEKKRLPREGPDRDPPPLPSGGF